MKIQHAPHHWILVALVLAALLLTLTELHGQATGAAAVFEGRPAMAGAQGGQGAQAGMPQGGLGVQGSELAERSVQPQKPSGLDEVRQDRRKGEDVVPAAADADTDTDTQLRKDAAPAPDKSLAKGQRSAKKVVRGAKRSISGARHGNASVDAVR